MVGPTASLTPGSPHAISPPPVGTLVLSLSVSTGWCSTGERRTKKKEREREIQRANVGTKDEREEGDEAEQRYQRFPHLRTVNV